MSKPRELARAVLREWTSFRLGGPCRSLFLCPSAVAAAETVMRLREAAIPMVLLGGGTNVLVSDDGVDAAAVRFCGAPMEVDEQGGMIVVDAAVELDALSAWCAKRGLAGLEFAAGIPGTVGGAVAVNAGAFGRQISDVLAWTDVLSADSARLRMEPQNLGFSYRRCARAETGDLFLRVALRVERGHAEALSISRDEVLAFRRARHPDWRRTPCAGSFFRNVAPSSAAARRQAAGWFLEQAGVAGMTEGGARVFERHCNIIVADGIGASAADVHRLALRMAEAVHARFGIRLEAEVRRIGSF